MKNGELRQSALGACDFLDVLEEAALYGTEVSVRLRTGERFVDVVLDVVTEGGENHVVFRGAGRRRVAEVEGVTRAGWPAGP
ncbi:MAG: hypothetical protein IRZ16_12945 [Myxococcaceae bacterium]|nr:hypothetical protein [Myxococcaceae bacterium]